MNLITAAEFKAMLLSGSNNLTNHHHEIDALNVFPVPDGDTGTNMNLTFSSGVDDLMKTHSEHVGELSKVLSKGLLMGARGNSGVILSQIFRGFYQSVETKRSLNAQDFSAAFVKGTEIAYKAVMRPVEGTILTVLRESANETKEYISLHPELDVIETLDFLIQAAHKSLQNTPELLPILKEVGVVDSGGAGYVKILEGFRLGLLGTPVELLENISISENGVQSALDNDEFGYCTEFIIRLNENTISKFSEDKLKEKLAHLGDSIVVVQDEDIVKVHVHTLTPGEALNLGQRFGEFVKLKIENMQEQHEHLQIVGKEEVSKDVKKKYALIAVAAGDGIVETFRSYRCDKVISGGQTMNPSTEDFVAAISELNAEHIFILPNNSNIILAAQQAQSILDDLDIHVLNTKTIPQGLSACIMFNPEVEVEENLTEMNEAFSRVKSASVTYAVKDTTFDGVEITAGDYMGILGKQIILSTQNQLETTQKLLDSAVEEEDGLITLIIGMDVSKEESMAIQTYIGEKFNQCELEIIEGNQPVYSYIIGIE